MIKPYKLVLDSTKPKDEDDSNDICRSKKKSVLIPPTELAASINKGLKYILEGSFNYAYEFNHDIKMNGGRYTKRKLINSRNKKSKRKNNLTKIGGGAKSNQKLVFRVFKHDLKDKDNVNDNNSSLNGVKLQHMFSRKCKYVNNVIDYGNCESGIIDMGTKKNMDSKKIGKMKMNGRAYGILEHGGKELFDIVSKDILTDIQKKHIIYQLLSALKCIHCTMYAHLDIKFDNILVKFDTKSDTESTEWSKDSTPIISLIDFDMAYKIGEEKPLCEGTPGYMYNCYKKITSYHDIWAICVMFLELYIGNIELEDDVYTYDDLFTKINNINGEDKQDFIKSMLKEEDDPNPKPDCEELMAHYYFNEIRDEYKAAEAAAPAAEATAAAAPAAEAAAPAADNDELDDVLEAAEAEAVAAEAVAAEAEAAAARAEAELAEYYM